jgi:hypothetical protein
MADSKCPYYEYIFEDLLKSSIGFPACKARPQEWKDANMTKMDYCKCNTSDYTTCESYLAQSRLEKETEA